MRRIIVGCFFFFLVAVNLQCFMFVGTFFFGDWGFSEIDHRNLTYKQYDANVGLEYFNPVGATEVSLHSRHYRDGYDVMWKMTIGKTDFDALLAKMVEKMKNPEFESYDSKRVGPVRKTTNEDPKIPEHWPSPYESFPDWWQLPKVSQGLECTRWELQVDKTGYSSRSKGWFWLYDSDTSLLWIWHRNHQHHDLGWEVNKTEEKTDKVRY